MRAIPADDHHACCQVLYRVAIHLRAHTDVERQVVQGLMEATHNIPLYLQSGDPHLGSQVQRDIDAFEKRFSERKGTPRLREIYDAALAAFRQSDAGNQLQHDR